jgi:hypothetical protein
VFKEHLHNLSADGLIQRFIPCVLNGDLTTVPREIPDFLTNEAAWEQTLRVVYALPPMTYTLSQEAKLLYQEFQVWYDGKRKDERLLQSDDVFMTAFGKVEGLTGRLALMFHLMESPFNPIVSAELISRAISLAKNYFIPVFRYALSDLGGISTFELWLKDYIIHHADEQILTLSEIKRSARRQLEKSTPHQADQAVINAIASLEDARWVIRIDDRTQEHRHIAQWAINPRLVTHFSDYRAKVIAAKQRQLDEIYKLSTRDKPKVHGND